MPRPRFERRSPWPTVMLGVVLLVGYALSQGPVAYLVVQKRISMRTYRALYAPFVWCGQKVPIVGDAIWEYRLLFVDEQEWVFASLWS